MDAVHQAGIECCHTADDVLRLSTEWPYKIKQKNAVTVLTMVPAGKETDAKCIVKNCQR